MGCWVDTVRTDNLTGGWPGGVTPLGYKIMSFMSMNVHFDTPAAVLIMAKSSDQMQQKIA